MARYPRAFWRPLPENETEPANHPRLVIFHVIVGPLEAAFQHFQNSSTSESHFGIGYGLEDHPVQQWLDTDREADTNWDANGISVTFEVAGYAHEPMNSFQLEECIQGGVWACRTHDIPPVLAQAPDGSGLGWHSQFPEWNRSNHSCPGQPRIDQLRGYVFPEIARRLEEQIMRRNDSAPPDQNIAVFQQHLNWWHPESPNLTPDGVFGKQTEDAVKSFQALMGLRQTGAWGELEGMRLAYYGAMEDMRKELSAHAKGPHAQADTAGLATKAEVTALKTRFNEHDHDEGVSGKPRQKA